MKSETIRKFQHALEVCDLLGVDPYCIEVDYKGTSIGLYGMKADEFFDRFPMCTTTEDNGITFCEYEVEGVVFRTNNAHEVQAIKVPA